MRREQRYTVIKDSDVSEALDADETETLVYLGDKIAAWREANGKIPLECVVVESDWPEYEPVWRMIEQRVDQKEPSTPHISVRYDATWYNNIKASTYLEVDRVEQEDDGSYTAVVCDSPRGGQEAEIQRYEERCSELHQAGMEICKAARNLRDMLRGDNYMTTIKGIRIERLELAEKEMGKAMAFMSRPLIEKPEAPPLRDVPEGCVDGHE